MARIYLSPPHMEHDERDRLLEAFDANWIAPAGPDLAMFEREFAALLGLSDAAALSSGTAALHLALLALGVGSGDDVLVSDLTFAASVNAITYVGARPVLIDADEASWTLDPDLLAEELGRRASAGSLPAAVVAVDLYGQCADYTRILPLCAAYGVPVLEDAAESLGASHGGHPAGSFGAASICSFNGNKIITTGGGGMLASDSPELVARARYLSTQAREPALHYEHLEVGFNYRMSNLLAAIGRGQLRSLESKVRRRRSIFDRYAAQLSDLPGVSFMPEVPTGRASRWLTCLQIEPAAFGATRDDVIEALEAQDIESRPTWKPMHLQPAFAELDVVGGVVGEQIFATGLCLPSGSSLADEDVDRIAEVVRRCSPAAP